MSGGDEAIIAITEPARDPKRNGTAPGQLPDLADAAAILALDDLPEEWVDVPEWNGRVRVVGLTGTERDRWEELRMVDKRDAKGKVKRQMDLTNFRASLVAMSVRMPDDRAKCLFEGQVPALGKKSAAALERVFDVARRLSRLTDEDIDELSDELKVGPSGERG